MRSFQDIYRLYGLREKKDKRIDALPNLDNDQKKAAKDFFSLHPHLESKLDWNFPKEIKWEEIEYLMKNTRYGRDLGQVWEERGEKDFAVVHKTDNEIYVIPYTWECAKFMGSPATYGILGRWCISSQTSPLEWNTYLSTGNVFFMRYDRKEHRKDMVQFTLKGESAVFWTYNNDDIPVRASELLASMANKHKSFVKPTPFDINTMPPDFSIINEYVNEMMEYIYDNEISPYSFNRFSYINDNMDSLVTDILIKQYELPAAMVDDIHAYVLNVDKIESAAKEEFLLVSEKEFEKYEERWIGNDGEFEDEVDFYGNEEEDG